MKAKLFFLLLLIWACNRNNYPASVKINQEAFQKHLKVINNSENAVKGVSVEKYKNAVIFLSVVTKINSKANYSSTVGYKNKKDFEENMRDWKDWFNINKSKLTDSYIDSCFAGIGISNRYEIGL